MTEISGKIYDIWEAVKKYSKTGDVSHIEQYTLNELEHASVYSNDLRVGKTCKDLLLWHINKLKEEKQNEVRGSYYRKHINILEKKNKKESWHRSFQTGITILIGLFTISITAWNVYITQKHSIEQNRPNLQIAVITENPRKATLILYNAGPGTAYDISCRVHLAARYLNSNVGIEWIYDVIRVAESLETKNDSTIEKYELLSIDSNVPIDNIPNVLAPGIEYGFRVSKILPSVLNALFIAINYRDASGRPYSTKINKGLSQFYSAKCLEYPIYKVKKFDDFQPASFYLILLIYSNNTYRNNWYYNWLEKQSTIQAFHGFPNAKSYMDSAKVEGLGYR